MAVVGLDIGSVAAKGVMLAEELGCPVLVPPDCQFTGALGAALLAGEG